MSTSFLPEIPLGKIGQHPSNPRRDAAADTELVESVKASGLLQPLVVAPAADVPALRGEHCQYVLIAGHRRLDALKKAKAKTAPAILRTDLVTEGQQVEAMLIENGRRADLSPVEEAEGYQQLELLGYTPKKIADAVGRDVKTVKSRLKLLTLSATTQKKVHAGQFTLEDAAAFTEFADDRAATKRLEQAAQQGQLKYAVTRERQTRERLQACHATVAALVDAGATEYQLPEGKTSPWQLPDQVSILASNADSRDVGHGTEHDGCFAYYASLDGTYPQVYVLCTNPAAHRSTSDRDTPGRAGGVTVEELNRQREEHQRAWEEKRAEQAAAAKVRIGTVMDLFGTNTHMPAPLRDVVRAVLPTLLNDLASSGTFPTLYFDALNVPAEDRWDYITTDAEQTLFAQHVADIDRWSDGILTRALVALLVAVADTWASPEDPDAAAHLVANRYWALLEESGHEFCDVDQQLRDALNQDDDAESEAS